jgi:hypothetical protein
MSRVNPDAFGTARPKIEPGDLEEDVAVLEIAEYSEMEVDDPNTESGKRMSACLTFQETGEKVVWLNKTAMTALVHYYGDDSDGWVGQPCPVEKVQGVAFGKSYHKVAVVPMDAWPEYVDNLTPPRAATSPKRKAARQRKTAKRKTTKRKGAKRGRK